MSQRSGQPAGSRAGGGEPAARLAAGPGRQSAFRREHPAWTAALAPGLADRAAAARENCRALAPVQRRIWLAGAEPALICPWCSYCVFHLLPPPCTCLHSFSYPSAPPPFVHCLCLVFRPSGSLLAAPLSLPCTVLCPACLSHPRCSALLSCKPLSTHPDFPAPPRPSPARPSFRHPSLLPT